MLASRLSPPQSKSNTGASQAALVTSMPGSASGLTHLSVPSVRWKVYCWRGRRGEAGSGQEEPWVQGMERGCEVVAGRKFLARFVLDLGTGVPGK